MSDNGWPRAMNSWPRAMNSWGSYSGDCYCSECVAAEPRVKESKGWRRHVRKIKSAARQSVIEKA